MNKEEQELRYKIRKIVNRPWRSPSIEEDELMALIPPRQEVLSEEEIIKVLNDNTALILGTPILFKQNYERVAKALSGRIAKPEAQKPVEEINKEQVLRLLHEKDYIRSLHSKIKEGLIGSLRSQYLGNNNYNQVNIAVETPYFRALVDMFTASLIYSTTDKLVEIVIDTIEALRQRVEEGR